MLPAPSSTFQQQERPPSRWYRNAWLIFSVALALRVALIFNFHLYRVPAQPHNHGQFGWEMGRVASAIASGHGFADPYGNTGPTAWVAPLYPYLMAGVFRLFGIYSVASAMTLMLINALFGALTIFPLREIAARCFSRKVAAGSIWLWAVWPFTTRYIAYLQEISLTPLLFTCVIALSLRMRGIGIRSSPSTGSPATLRQWLLLGFLWGILALTDPSTLLCLPVCFLWILAGTWTRNDRARFPRQLRRTVFAGFLCIGCMLPWTIRNAVVFHTFLPIRSDLGEEIYQGNGPGSHGASMVWDNPVYSLKQFHLYRSMGEVDYCRMRGAEAIAFIRRHPAHFIVNVFHRAYYFWFGFPQPSNQLPLDYAPVINVIFMSICGLLGLLLAMREQAPGTGLLAWILLFYPLTFYLVNVENHHRHPIAPILYILTIYLWTSAEEGYRVRIFTPAWWRARFAATAKAPAA